MSSPGATSPTRAIATRCAPTCIGGSPTTQHAASTWSCWVRCGALGAQPRFGSSYAFEARGGTAGMLHIEGPVLPGALAVTTLEQQSRVPQAALSLAWTGQRGTEPLVIRLGVFPRLGGTTEQYTIICNA